MTPTLPSDSDSWQDDLQLVRDVLAGDVPALERFIRRMKCVPVILSHCNSRHRGMLSREDLSDLSQEVLTAVWRRLPSYRGQAALESWVHPFCTQMYLNCVRARRRRPTQSDLESVGPLTAPDEGMQDLLEASDLIHRHLARLEALQADVIRARHFESLSFEEIARRLEVPLTTVRNNYRRGLETLRIYIAPHLGPDPA